MNVISLPTWLEENKKNFLPPVCNKMLYDKGQMKAFFVGGPNQREDYHIEAGEELFYMWKGDMCLKIVENNQHKDVHIKEGEIFLLPSNVYHSPQRQADTIGWVLERERLPHELDGLKYFVKDNNNQPTLNTLFERYFYVTDLGTQLPPVIKEFFESSQHKTGQPVKEDLVADPPVKYDCTKTVQQPFHLKQWIHKHKEVLLTEGPMDLFQPYDGQQFGVQIFGEGNYKCASVPAETWLWLVSGTASVVSGEKEAQLSTDECVLIEENQPIGMHIGKDSFILRCFQDASRKNLI